MEKETDWIPSTVGHKMVDNLSSLNQKPWSSYTHTNGTHRACFVSRESRSLTETQDLRVLVCSEAHQRPTPSPGEPSLEAVCFPTSCLVCHTFCSTFYGKCSRCQERALSPSCLSSQEILHSYFLRETQIWRKGMLNSESPSAFISGMSIFRGWQGDV